MIQASLSLIFSPFSVLIRNPRAAPSVHNVYDQETYEHIVAQDPSSNHTGLLDQNMYAQKVYDYIKAKNLSSNLAGPPKFHVIWGPYESDINYYNKHYNNTIFVKDFSCYQNQTLRSDYENASKCLANPYYIWGFSSVILYIILSLQLVWTIGMFMVWLDANIYSKLCRKRRKMRGIFRNVLNLAEALKELLKNDFCAYSNSEIARQLNKSRYGLQFYSTSDTDDGISHIGISSFAGDRRLRLVDHGLYGARAGDQK